MRQRYLVGVRKVPHAERDVARSVLGDTGEARDFRDVIGADTPDDDPTFPVGSHCTYAVELDDDEAEQFAAASNCRHINPDGMMRPLYTDITPLDDEDSSQPRKTTRPTDTDPLAVSAPAGSTASNIPLPSTAEWMRTVFSGASTYHGQDVPIAILDQGTTSIVRQTMAHTLLGKKVFSTQPPAGEVHPNDQGHGCLVTPNGVPYGGRFFEGLISEPEGGATYTAISQGLRWATDVGAKLVNLSFGGPDGVPAMEDAIQYAAAAGVEFYAAAGNNGEPFAAYPAAYQAVYPNVHAIIAFNDVTDSPASFTNYAGSLNGCAPGVQVTSLLRTGALVRWSGTSAATPHALSLVARLMTSGRLTATQAATIMEQNLRNTEHNPHQGMGAFNLLAPLQASITQYGLGRTAGALLAIN